MAYATEADLVPTYLAAAPDNVDQLLTRASRAVDRALLTAVYPVDGDGLPTETAHIAALMEATCEQAASWAEVDETGTGTSDRYDDVQIGSVRLARRGSQAGAGGATGSAAARLAPQAWDVLQQAGLTGHEPYTYVPCTAGDDG